MDKKADFDKDAFKEGYAKKDAPSNGSASWKPPGRMLHSYKSFGNSFQIWESPLMNPETRSILTNMRIFIPFFIEGGTVDFLDEPDWAIERWKVFLLYEVSGSDYTLAGFSTSYRAWVFPTTDILKTMQSQSTSSELPPSSHHNETGISAGSQFADMEKRSPMDVPSRERISQFVILPPYQGQAHGTWLYLAMTSLFRRDVWCFEITVEEPNEEFDALRDFCDMAYLYSLPKLSGIDTSFKDLRFSSTPIPRSSFDPENFIPTDELLPLPTLSLIRYHAKIAPRQFHRLLEIHLLSTIPPRHRETSRITRKFLSADQNDKNYYFWRLLVKERVFMKNRDQLLQIDENERIQKVEDTLGGLQEEYKERIDQFGRRMRKGLADVVGVVMAEKEGQANGGADAGVGNNGSASGRAGASGKRGKRKVISDDDEDDEEDEETVKSAKRPKVTES
jgi:histone acetyltransferase 1